MSDNETIHTDPDSGGMKAGNLERHGLIPVEPLRELARHYGRGARKYADDNWRLGYDWHLSYDALQRHASAFWGGEDIDEETGSHHLTAVAWHAFTLYWFSLHRKDKDDRPNSVAAQSETPDLSQFPNWRASLGSYAIPEHFAGREVIPAPDPYCNRCGTTHPAGARCLRDLKFTVNTEGIGEAEKRWRAKETEPAEAARRTADTIASAYEAINKLLEGQQP